MIGGGHVMVVAGTPFVRGAAWGDAAVPAGVASAGLERDCTHAMVDTPM